MGRRVLVLDFDGTAYRGDAPVLGYARAAAKRLPPAAGARLTGIIDGFCATGTVPAGAAGREPEDGWDAVGLVADRFGVRPGPLRDAFEEARAALAAGRYRLQVPSELVGLVRWCRRSARCRVVLISNSPDSSVTPVLGMLGLAGEFDRVVGDANKPDGLLAAACTAVPGAEPGDILSVGDHHPNDIAPALAAGAAAGYLNPYGLAGRPATFSASRLELMYPDIRRWCAGARSDVPAGRRVERTAP